MSVACFVVLFVVLFVATAKHWGRCPWWDGGLGVGVAFAWRLLVFFLVGAPLVLWSCSVVLFFCSLAQVLSFCSGLSVLVLLGVGAVLVPLFLAFRSLLSALVLLLFAALFLFFRSCSSVLFLLSSRLPLYVFRHLTEHDHPPI